MTSTVDAPGSSRGASIEHHLRGVRQRAWRRITQPRPPHRPAPRIFEPSLSGVGVVIGLYFFSVSLTPSLLPRAGYTQGLNSGVAFMIGYGIGVALYALWRFFEIPPARGRVRIALVLIVMTINVVQTSLAIWAYVGWQNETRLAFGMDPLSPMVWPVIVAVALVTAAVILIVGRSLRALFRWADDLLDDWLPQRLAVAVAAVILVLALWWVFSGAFVNAFFTTSNWIFSARDDQQKPGVEQPPPTAHASGGPGSAMAWEDLGREGRSFVSTGPTAQEIADFTGTEAQQPIRAYVGMRSAETLQERADLLLDELQRTGAFDREILVVATTTGTGFLAPHAMDSLEYLWNGDTAIAGAQYSYLPSWISLLADQEEVQETSRVMFRTIHDHWSTLPETSRPQLYLYGLSLGTYGVEAILSSADILNEPIDGALMVGPTFVNEMRAEITANRDAGSPAWLPQFNDGRTVRFMDEQGGLERGSAPWDGTRVVYLQHGSDPVVWFNQRLAFDEPAWLEGERAPDVSETMAWYPVVTMWQVLLDLPAAGSIPDGFGHLYTHHANLEAWAGVTAAPDWTDADTDALATHLDQREAAREAAMGLDTQ